MAEKSKGAPSAGLVAKAGADNACGLAPAPFRKGSPNTTDTTFFLVLLDCFVLLVIDMSFNTVDSRANRTTCPEQQLLFVGSHHAGTRCSH